MYKVRLWSSRNARLFESIYLTTEPLINVVIKSVNKLSFNRLDLFITFFEKNIKSFFFDCKMCGNCILSSTGMSCPMNCPKTIRNGPCGGVRDNGYCEVEPKMRCVWVEAWNGSKNMKYGDKIKTIQYTVKQNEIGTSSWLKVARDQKDERKI